MSQLSWGRAGGRVARCGSGVLLAGAVALIAAPCGWASQITITKQTSPAGDPTQFSFHLSGKPTDEPRIIEKDFTLADGQSVTFDLPKSPGYKVTERAQDGWRLKSIE